MSRIGVCRDSQPDFIAERVSSNSNKLTVKSAAGSTKLNWLKHMSQISAILVRFSNTFLGCH